MREEAVEEQIQQILSYVQEGLADVWKKNVLEDLEKGNLEYEIAEELLIKLRRKFRGEEEETVKAAKLRRLEQEEKTIEEFIQEFR